MAAGWWHRDNKFDTDEESSEDLINNDSQMQKSIAHVSWAAQSTEMQKIIY